MRDLPSGALKDCGCGPGTREVDDLSGLGDTAPASPTLEPIRPIVRDVQPNPPVVTAPVTVVAPGTPGAQDPAVAAVAPAPPPIKRRKPRSKGSGAHCVISHKGNVVHCYHDAEVAQKVADVFGEKTGTKFTVKDRNSP